MLRIKIPKLLFSQAKEIKKIRKYLKIEFDTEHINSKKAEKSCKKL